VGRGRVFAYRSIPLTFVAHRRGMTAIACLKVFVGDELRFADNDTMAGPGRQGGRRLSRNHLAVAAPLWLVAPFSFVLADPRATKLDARELQALARDLQFKLFGDKGAGDIALLMFEGDQTDVMRFAGLHGAELKALLNGEDDGSVVGRVCRITPTEVSSVVPQGGPVCGAPTMEELAALASTMPTRPARRPGRLSRRLSRAPPGVHRQRRRLAARPDGIGLRPNAATVSRRIRPEDDIPTLAGAAEALAAVPVGVMFFPISFSTMVKPGRPGRAAAAPGGAAARVAPSPGRRRLRHAARAVLLGPVPGQAVPGTVLRPAGPAGRRPGLPDRGPAAGPGQQRHPGSAPGGRADPAGGGRAASCATPRPIAASRSGRGSPTCAPAAN
jgi:hypothetical protein